jgi:fumarate reductase subunit C
MKTFGKYYLAFIITTVCWITLGNLIPLGISSSSDFLVAISFFSIPLIVFINVLCLIKLLRKKDEKVV